MLRQQETGPAPVLTTIDRQNESENGSTSIAENPEGQPQQQDNDTIIANNTVMASSGEPLYLAWRHYPSGDTPTGNNTNIFASSSDGTNFETSEELQNMTICSMAASGNTSYVAGAGSENEDVIVARSGDGTSFNTTSVANGSFPDIAANWSKVYVVWTDDENEIFFAASTDGGKTFGEKQSLSNEGFWPKVAMGDGVLAAWTENSDIMAASPSLALGLNF